MREGFNPIKVKNEKNLLKNHRIIVVLYIPDSSEKYFEDLHIVLDKCLYSLINTINFETTSITLINNGSGFKAEKVIDKYIEYIDKYVVYNENKGKVYAVLNEVRGVYEKFVTITDADILFYSGWERAVFNCFQSIPNAGVVSPMPLPYLTFHFNRSIFGLNTLIGRIKYSKFVEDKDIDLYTSGTNLPNLIQRKNHKYNWKERQYHYKGYVLGSYHVVSTYRIEQFRNIYDFPEKVFENSYESFFIDNLSENLGLYRLSTKETYAYHMGNKLDDVTYNYETNFANQITKNEFNLVRRLKKGAN